MKINPPGSELFSQIDWQGAEAEFSLINFFDAKNYKVEDLLKEQSQKVIIVSDELSPEQVVRYVAETKVKSLVQKNGKFFVHDLRATANSLNDAGSYFESGGRSLLSTTEREVEIHFSSQAEKAELKRQVEKFLEVVQSQNVHESTNAIVEELYMNAMIDAPREAAKLGQASCTYGMGLHSSIRLIIGDSRLVISCEDPFGSLVPSKIINRMNEVYKKGAGEAINLKGAGGAGLGCVIMFEHCEALHLGVKPGLKTLVSVIVPLGLSYRQRDNIKKSLNIIEG